MTDRIYCCQTESIRYAEGILCDGILCCRFCSKYGTKKELIDRDGSKHMISDCYHECSEAWKQRCKYKCTKGRAETAKLMRKMTLKPPKLVLSEAGTLWVNRT